MNVFYKTEQELTNENIETIVNELTDVYLKTVERDAYTKIEFQLALEEVLVGFRDHWDSKLPCRVMFYRRFGVYSISLSQTGQRKTFSLDQTTEFTLKLLTKLDIFPRYVYSREDGGRNKLICANIIKEKKHSLLGPILIAAAAAVLAGIGIN